MIINDKLNESYSMAKHLRFSLRIFPFVFGIFMVMMTYQAERFFFPVINHFSVTNVKKIDTGYILSGVYIKKRDCEFLGTNVIAKDEGLLGKETYLYHVEIDRPIALSESPKEPIGTILPARKWVVNFPPDNKFESVSVYSIYKCHPLWITENKVLEVNAPPRITKEGAEINNEELTEIFNQRRGWYNP